MTHSLNDDTTYFLTRRVFLQGMALIYAIAFASLGVQITGLVGQNGVLPAQRYLDVMRQEAEHEGQSKALLYWRMPTIAWLDAGDAALQTYCAAGVLAAALAFAQITTGPMFLVLWGLYLSLCSACPIFLNYQWDTLLLEAGLLAVLYAPWRLRSTGVAEEPPSNLVLWLIRWLLFRLMFASGFVKLASRDETWWDLTALQVHYETQPIPTWTAWYMHQFPAWAHVGCCAIMFFIELVVPWIMFIPHRPRLWSCGVLVLFQLVIAATGNYTFFNALTIVLCLSLLDDRALRRLLPRRWLRRMPRRSVHRRLSSFARLRGTIRRTGVRIVAGVLLLASTLHFMNQLFRHTLLPSTVTEALAWVSPLRSVNTYGLFANMTEKRPEIVIEGSHDGVTWLAYEFMWKPGDVMRRPRFVAPHQPRLDWQMWFAALGGEHNRQIVQNLMYRLLQGHPAVLNLLDKNPFPDAPPRHVRAMYYDYHFTSRQERKETGAWWKRTLLGGYLGPMSLRP